MNVVIENEKPTQHCVILTRSIVTVAPGGMHLRHWDNYSSVDLRHICNNCGHLSSIQAPLQSRICPSCQACSAKASLDVLDKLLIYPPCTLFKDGRTS